MRLSDLMCYDPITIQCHDNPDADTIGSGYGLYCFFRSKGNAVRLIYSGHNKIHKANLCLMTEKLSIPIEYVPPEEIIPLEGLLITVDCQYGAGNVTRMDADTVAVIDHHPLELSSTEQYRIQSGLGSCATLVWGMLLEENYPVNGDVNLGTALFYGLYTDTNQFSELFNPLDMDMREALIYNKQLMTQFRYSNLSLKELEIAGIAMIRYNYNSDYRFAVIKAKPCDPNILGIISDFLIQVDEVDCGVVYNEANDGFKVSVRSCIKEVNAKELAVYLTEGIGSGGGHYEKAGGFISMRMYEEKYPIVHSEAYFNNRMTEYFESFSCIVASETEMDPADMKCYRRIQEPMCYICATDLVEAGAHISIRTQAGNEDMCVESDLYFSIERDGTLHILMPERFRRFFQATQSQVDADYWENMEYIPIVKSWADGNSYLMSEYGKVAMPKEEFQIYAKKLEHAVKVFPEWDEERYMLGRQGDYLAASTDDLHNIFVEPGKNFLKKFEEIGTKGS